MLCFINPLNGTLTLVFRILADIIMAETRKPDKLYGTHPKNYGKGARPCRVTGRMGGHGLIRKYGINMKRQTFRERALDMGWVKYS
jgi:small subunit ribosomal protein S29e